MQKYISISISKLFTILLSISEVFTVVNIYNFSCQACPLFCFSSLKQLRMIHHILHLLGLLCMQTLKIEVNLDT